MTLISRAPVDGPTTSQHLSRRIAERRWQATECNGGERRDGGEKKKAALYSEVKG